MLRNSIWKPPVTADLLLSGIQHPLRQSWREVVALSCSSPFGRSLFEGSQRPSRNLMLQPFHRVTRLQPSPLPVTHTAVSWTRETGRNLVTSENNPCFCSHFCPRAHIFIQQRIRIQKTELQIKSYCFGNYSFSLSFAVSFSLPPPQKKGGKKTSVPRTTEVF